MHLVVYLLGYGDNAPANDRPLNHDNRPLEKPNRVAEFKRIPDLGLSLLSPFVFPFRFLPGFLDHLLSSDVETTNIKIELNRQLKTLPRKWSRDIKSGRSTLSENKNNLTFVRRDVQKSCSNFGCQLARDLANNSCS